MGGGKKKKKTTKKIGGGGGPNFFFFFWPPPPGLESGRSSPTKTLDPVARLCQQKQLLEKHGPVCVTLSIYMYIYVKASGLRPRNMIINTLRLPTEEQPHTAHHPPRHIKIVM